MWGLNNSQPFTTFRVLGPCHYHIKSVAEMRPERQVLVVIVCTTSGNSMHQPTPSSNSMHSTSNSASSTSNSIHQPTAGLLSACQYQRCPSNWQPLRFKAVVGGSGQWGCLTLHCVSSAFCLAQLTGDCFVVCFCTFNFVKSSVVMFLSDPSPIIALTCHSVHLLNFVQIVGFLYVVKSIW